MTPDDTWTRIDNIVKHAADRTPKESATHLLATLLFITGSPKGSLYFLEQSRGYLIQYVNVGWDSEIYNPLAHNEDDNGPSDPAVQAAIRTGRPVFIPESAKTAGRLYVPIGRSTQNVGLVDLSAPSQPNLEGFGSGPASAVVSMLRDLYERRLVAKLLDALPLMIDFRESFDAFLSELMTDGCLGVRHAISRGFRVRSSTIGSVLSCVRPSAEFS